MAADHPLRRWKPFLASFDVIDAAIEAAVGLGVSRDEFRRARCAIVERLCDAPDDEDESDELCRNLDRAMVQALLTLQVVPVAPATLAKTELVPAVRALRKHECDRVRALARDIVRGWRAAAEGDLVKVRAAADKLAQIVLPAERKRTLPPPPAAGVEQEAAGDGEAERAEAASRHEKAEQGEALELGYGEALFQSALA